MDGTKLRAVRLHRNWTQEQAAEAMNVGLSTYQRWEHGDTTPYGVNLQSIQEVFGLTAKELGINNECPFLPGPSNAPLFLPYLQAFASQDMEMRLGALSFQSFRSYRDVQKAMSRILEDDDMLNLNHHINRREALRRLAAFPIATLLGGTTLQPALYGTVLMQCPASIEACWRLCRSDNADDLHLAFECASAYLVALQHIVRDASQYRKRAAGLAARCSLLKTILSWHTQGLFEAIDCAKEAIGYSKVANDAPLLLSAYSKLSWAYFYSKKYRSALVAAQEARFFLEETKVPLPGGIVGGTYSTLALMEAKNGLNTDRSLGIVIESDPGDEISAFMEFTRPDVPREVSLIHCYRGDAASAMKTLAEIIDPATLSIKPVFSGRGRVEVYNTMTLALLNAKERDMEKAVHLWTSSITEAKALRSEWGFNETVTLYDLMRVAWPGEQRIAELRELAVHW